jgi:hypothetical protein
VEGAEALQVPPGFLQPQVFRDEIHQVKAILDLLDGILFDRRHGGKLTAWDSLRSAFTLTLHGRFADARVAFVVLTTAT